MGTVITDISSARPLIQAPAVIVNEPISRWHQDIEVHQLIEHLDHPSKRDQWDKLTPAEIRTILKELDRCRKDFVYAARNYFWIKNKKRQEMLFTLWPGQELILARLLELKAKNQCQKLLCIKGRQLGLSTLAEALVAWRTMFFSGSNALVVSYDNGHAANVLFPIMCFILDRMPWWLQPMVSSRKSDEGIFFENKDYKARGVDPGLNSHIYVKGANSTTGVGQGISLHCVHSCLSPDMLVHTGDGRAKPIREVSEGDVIRTSRGRLSKVKHRWRSHRFNEETTEIKLWGMPFPLSTTVDHKIFTPDGFVEAGKIKKGGYVRTSIRPITNEIDRLSFHQCTTGGTGLARRRNTSEEYGEEEFIPNSFDSGYFFGLYLAEGSVSFNKRLSKGNTASRITFTVHEKEVDRVAKIIERVTRRSAKIHKANGKAVNIELNAAGIARMIAKNFGFTDSKTIPDWVWSCGSDFCRGIVCGYLEGDGYISSSRLPIVATSTRTAITLQMRDLLASLGYGWASITQRAAGRYYNRNCKAIWILNINGENCEKLRRDLGWPVIKGDKALHSKVSECGKYIDIQVASVNKGFSEEFYDLEVEAEEHDYATVQCVVANSEIADWEDSAAKEIIEEDMKNALAEDDPDTFAILETTAKGANRYIHKLWKKSILLAAKGREEWSPIFVPAFFEASRVRAVSSDWEPQQHEERMRGRILDEWVRCDSLECKQYHTRHIKGLPDRDGTLCPACNAGTLKAFVISDQQLAWFEHRRENATDEQSRKVVRQELCIVPQDAFQLYAIAIFPDAAQEFAADCVLNPIAYGDFDAHGRFHGMDTDSERGKEHHKTYGWFPCFCEGCNLNHFADDAPCLIWEWPEKDAIYCCGADIGEGLKQCYSVGVVMKVSKTGGCDYQVATWRSNEVDVISFARQLNWLGRNYNDAMMSPECNKFDTVVHTLRMQHGYPNIYRWKHLDSINVLSQKLGWYTSVSSRPRLYQTMRTWLLQQRVILRSANLIEEIPNFAKEDEDTTIARGDQGSYDDELIAAMIALYCAHEDDYSEAMGSAIPRDKITIDNSVYRITCNACGHIWPADEMMSNRISMMRCEKCGSMAVSVSRNEAAMPPTADAVMDEISNGWTPQSDGHEYGKGVPDYSIL